MERPSIFVPWNDALAHPSLHDSPLLSVPSPIVVVATVALLFGGACCLVSPTPYMAYSTVPFTVSSTTNTLALRQSPGRIASYRTDVAHDSTIPATPAPGGRHLLPWPSPSTVPLSVAFSIVCLFLAFGRPRKTPEGGCECLQVVIAGGMEPEARIVDDFLEKLGKPISAAEPGELRRARGELQEAACFLRDKCTSLGATAPNNCGTTGSLGTSGTLRLKAMAADAGGPCLVISPNDFVGFLNSGVSAQRGEWSARLAGLLVATSERLLRTRLPVLLCLADLLNCWDDAAEYNAKLNKFLQGPFAPVEHEHFGLPMTVVAGAVPEGLEGLYLRVGPNPTKRTLSRGHHLFDGHGMIHSIRIANGAAVYSNQYVRTPRLELEEQHRRPVLFQVGEFRGVVGILKAAVLAPLISWVTGLPPELQWACNTNVYLHDARLYVGHEGSYPMEIQWQEDHSFDTLGYNTMGGRLDFPVTAHPKVDPEDGRLYFNGYNAVHAVDMKYGVYSEGQLQTYVPFHLSQKSFMHDMLITEHYVIFFESSVAVDAKGIVNGKFLKYNNQHRMRVGLFPKLSNDSAAVRWFDAPGSMGTVHAMNAWEVGPAEVAVFASGMQAFDSNGKHLLPSYLHYFRLNLHTGTMAVEVVDATHMVDFTRVHPKFLGRPSQFGFAGGFTAKADWFSGVVKFDLFTRKVAGSIMLPEGTLCGEPVPIPKPGPAGLQSDGVYLGFFVHSEARPGGEWRLYDGETMSPQPVVCLAVGEHVPIGFHGEWVAQPDLLAHIARGRAA